MCSSYGTWLTVQSRFVDPALEHDLTSPTKPWALSPLIATVPNFVHSHVGVHHVPEDKSSERREEGLFPPPTSISDDTSHLSVISVAPSDDSQDGAEPASKSDPVALRFRTSGERRKYFRKEFNRKDLIFGPNVRPFVLTSCLNTNTIATGPYFYRLLLRFLRIQSETCPPSSWGHHL